jgi:hypothetical protein
MYQPGMDQGLARILYAEVLEEATQERAEHQEHMVALKWVARGWVLAMAAAAPIAVVIIWAVAAH